jgi:hypothetical protein
MHLSQPTKAVEQFKGRFWTDKLLLSKLTFPPRVRRTTRVPQIKIYFQSTNIFLYIINH